MRPARARGGTARLPLRRLRARSRAARGRSSGDRRNRAFCANGGWAGRASSYPPGRSCTPHRSTGAARGRWRRARRARPARRRTFRARCAHARRRRRVGGRGRSRGEADGGTPEPLRRSTFPRGWFPGRRRRARGRRNAERALRSCRFAQVLAPWRCARRRRRWFRSW